MAFPDGLSKKVAGSERFGVRGDSFGRTFWGSPSPDLFQRDIGDIRREGHFGGDIEVVFDYQVVLTVVILLPSASGPHPEADLLE
jgi:hypothetical protein